MPGKGRSSSVSAVVRGSLEATGRLVKKLARASNPAHRGKLPAAEPASKMVPSSASCGGCLPWVFSSRSRRGSPFDLEEDDSDDEVIIVKNHIALGASLPLVVETEEFFGMKTKPISTVNSEMEETIAAFLPAAPVEALSDAPSAAAPSAVTAAPSAAGAAPPPAISEEELVVDDVDDDGLISEAEDAQPISAAVNTPVAAATPTAATAASLPTQSFGKLFRATPPRAMLSLSTPVDLSYFVAGASQRAPSFEAEEAAELRFEETLSPASSPVVAEPKVELEPTLVADSPATVPLISDLPPEGALNVYQVESWIMDQEAKRFAMGCTAPQEWVPIMPWEVCVRGGITFPLYWVVEPELGKAMGKCLLDLLMESARAVASGAPPPPAPAYLVPMPGDAPFPAYWVDPELGKAMGRNLLAVLKNTARASVSASAGSTPTSFVLRAEAPEFVSASHSLPAVSPGAADAGA